MSLKDKLLESYITASLNQAPASSQDLGRRFCRYPNKALEIMKEAFGESCRKYGQVLFEGSQSGNPQAAISDIQGQMVSESVASSIDFSVGVCDETRRQGVLFMHTMMAMMNPEGFRKEVSDEFMRRLNERDIPGMLDFYSQHSAEIDAVHSDAREFVEFLKNTYKGVMV